MCHRNLYNVVALSLVMKTVIKTLPRHDMILLFKTIVFVVWDNDAAVNHVNVYTVQYSNQEMKFLSAVQESMM